MDVLCSYLHRNVTMKFLTCEPNLARASNYTDEADLFYKSPETWLAANNFTSRDATTVDLPTHLVMFDELHVRTAALLRDSRHGYWLCGRFFHTHFPEGRVSMHVVVLCRVRWMQAVRQHSTSFFYPPPTSTLWRPFSDETMSLLFLSFHFIGLWLQYSTLINDCHILLQIWTGLINVPCIIAALLYRCYVYGL